MNVVRLGASIAETQALRFTPAGLPALDLWLEHQSTQTEAERERTTKARVRAVAFGATAERLSRVAVGSQWVFSGFLANWRGGRQVALHIREFQTLS